MMHLSMLRGMLCSSPFSTFAAQVLLSMVVEAVVTTLRTRHLPVYEWKIELVQGLRGRESVDRTYFMRLLVSLAQSSCYLST